MKKGCGKGVTQQTFQNSTLQAGLHRQPTTTPEGLPYYNIFLLAFFFSFFLFLGWVGGGAGAGAREGRGGRRAVAGEGGDGGLTLVPY